MVAMQLGNIDRHAIMEAFLTQLQLASVQPPVMLQLKSSLCVLQQKQKRKVYTVGHFNYAMRPWIDRRHPASVYCQKRKGKNQRCEALHRWEALDRPQAPRLCVLQATRNRKDDGSKAVGQDIRPGLRHHERR